MKRSGPAFLLIACCLTASAQGYWQSRTQVSVGSAPPAYVGPGDIVSGAKVWYSCSWGYNAADVADACDVCLPADTTCAHITLSSGVAVVPGSLSTCNITTVICTVKTMFDKGSLASNVTNATIANRPTFRPAMASNGCPTTAHPCILFTAASSQTLASANLTIPQPLTQVQLYSKSAGTSGLWVAGGCFLSSNSTNLIANCGSSIVASGLADSTWHASQFVANGVSSEIYVDGSSNVTGDANTGSVSGQPVTIGFEGFNFLNASVGEFGIWPVAFNGTQEGNIQTNIKTTRWGY